LRPQPNSHDHHRALSNPLEPPGWSLRARSGRARPGLWRHGAARTLEAHSNGFTLGLDTQKVYVKHQGFVRADARRRTPDTVSLVGRNEHLPVIADVHARDDLAPALDHLVHRKHHGFAAVLGIVEHGAIQKLAAVLQRDFAVECRALVVLVALAAVEHLVLHAGWQRDHALLLAVLDEERVRLFQIRGRDLFVGGTGLGHHPALHGLDDLLHHLRRILVLLARVTILHAAQHSGDVDVETALPEVETRLVAERVGKFRAICHGRGR